MYEHEKVNLNSIWQIEHITDDNFGDNFYSYMNNEEMLTPKMTTKALKLRHFLTGRLFTLKQELNKETSFHTCLGREEDFSNHSQNKHFENKTSKFNDLPDGASKLDMDDDSDYFEDDDP